MDNVYFAEKIQAHKAKVRKSKWAVWSWVALGVLLVGYVVFVQLSQAGERKLLAKLKHEKDVNEEKTVQAIANAKVEVLTVKKDKIRAEIVARIDRSAKIDEEIELREVKRDELHERISKLKDWDDIDSNVVFRSKPGDN